MAGAPRSTVNDILRELDHHGTVRVACGRLEVLDLLRLGRSSWILCGSAAALQTARALFDTIGDLAGVA
jgi:hypothetical protein